MYAAPRALKLSRNVEFEAAEALGLDLDDVAILKSAQAPVVVPVAGYRPPRSLYRLNFDAARILCAMSPC